MAFLHDPMQLGKMYGLIAQLLVLTELSHLIYRQ